MPVRPSPYYNDYGIGAGIRNLADAFGPPPAADLANYSLARQRNQQSDIAAKLAADPRYADFDHQAIIGDLYDPTQSFIRVNADDATARRGQDIAAATSRENNAADNRALFASTMFRPVGQGESRPAVPDVVSTIFGLPAMDAVAGAPKPLNESEWQAEQNQRLLNSGALTDQNLVDVTIGQRTPVEVVGSEGKPVYMAPGEAARTAAQVAPKSPLVNIGPNGESYGSPGDGLVWARNADGTVKLDDRGAPIAIPFQGGKAWQAEQAAKNATDAKDANADLKGGVVVQDLDRALSAITGNPLATTGVGSQLTGWVGGTPAQSVASLLDSVKANVGFDQLQALRAASPTGGALGPVSDAENRLLQSALGSIDPHQPADQLADNLKRIKNLYLDTIHGPGNGPPRERLSFPSQWDQFAPPAAARVEALPAGVTEADIAHTMQLYGVSREEVLRRIGAR